MGMAAPAVVAFGKEQHVVAHGMELLPAKRALIRGRLVAVNAPRIPPERLVGHLASYPKGMPAPHPEELRGLSRSEVLRASPRMFDSNLLDKLSRVHPAVPPIIFVPSITLLLVLGFIHGSGLLTPIELIGGYLFWTLTEYWLHRIVFHFEPEQGFGARMHWIIHGVHHDHPNDPMRLAVSIPLAAIFLFLFHLVLGTPAWLPFGAAFLAGYLFYDMLHYHVHHHRPTTALGKRLRELHMRHHFQDHDRGYGVSAPFWDHVFGTAPSRRS
jgi:sterol desaturase/sphingolipid hydroxylase (fatty acid hydroxylase superfamily)